MNVTFESTWRTEVWKIESWSGSSSFQHVTEKSAAYWRPIITRLWGLWVIRCYKFLHIWLHFCTSHFIPIIWAGEEGMPVHECVFVHGAWVCSCSLEEDGREDIVLAWITYHPTWYSYITKYIYCGPGCAKTGKYQIYWKALYRERQKYVPDPC